MADAATIRGNWTNPLQFVLACIGYAVGLGNVWRFPYLVYRNGGGAFLVPYFLMAIVLGLPIFFAELFVGQYSSLGPIKAFEFIAPFFKGLGYCVLIVITFVSIYYMVVIAWIIFYFFASFQARLPWGHCDNDFNTQFCYSSLEDRNCQDDDSGEIINAIYYNRTCTFIKDICIPPDFIAINLTHCLNTTSNLDIPVRSIIKRVLASEEYYYENVLGLDDASWSNWGWPRWQLVLCLLLGWVIAFACLMKGVQSAGKAVYFTALFPYVVLTALLIRGLTLEGSSDGVSFYITPHWETLLEPSVWADAASQIFYSFGLACGSLVAFASYNRYQNNCHRDAIFVSLTNLFTCIYAGFAVFSILGFLAKSADVQVDDVVQNGPGLAFIAYPEAVLLMPWSNVWAVLFFFMMFTLGLGSQFGGIEALCTSLVDQWPNLAENRWLVTAGVCFCCFIAGLPMVCNGGIYLFTLMEWHTASWAILLLGLAEVVVLSWVYGMKRTFENLSDMSMELTGIIRFYWKACFVVLTPIASVLLFVFTMSGTQRTNFRGQLFPIWADFIGWCMGLCTLIPFVVFAIYKLWKSKGSFEELFKPTDQWQSQTNKGPSAVNKEPDK